MSYWGKNFFGFFHTLFERIGLALQGQPMEMASDEIQILTLICIGVAAAMVGCFLVLRKMAMVANAISHTVLLGLVGSFLILHYFFSKPFSEMLELDMKLLIMAALGASVLTMFFTDFLHNTLKLARDSSIGLVFTSLFSVGIILVTIFTKNTHIGAEIIMGNVDMLHRDDLWIAMWLVIGNFLCISLVFKEYVITSFDSQFAKLSKISPVVLNYVVIFQTSLTLVGAFRAVGVVLVLALLVVPPVTARLFVRRVKPMIFVSALISSVAAILSVAVSRHIVTVYGFALSTSGLLVFILFLIWLGSLTLTRRR